VLRLLTLYNLLKLSWPKTLVKKWFNIRSKAEDFHADDVGYGGVIMAYHFCQFLHDLDAILGLWNWESLTFILTTKNVISSAIADLLQDSSIP
jgi:hypothetical protein